MKAIKLLIFALALSIHSYVYADDVETTFSYSNWVESKQLDEKAALHKVRLTNYITYVTIKVVPQKNKKRLNYWTSPYTYVVSGNAKLPLLGAQGENNTYHSCTYNDNWGWDNVKQGQEYFYTLMFSGRIPAGQTIFSLVDEANSGNGYSFKGYTINNPSSSIKRDEVFCKKNIDNNNDGICGIYEEIGGNRYRIACVKHKTTYYLVYLGCSEKISWWFEGDFKGKLEESAVKGTFKAQWIMKNKTPNNDAFITFDGKSMKCFIPDGNPSESMYLKMYPNSSSSGNGIGSAIGGASEWTGTGFALRNNYLVTNYHVIESAKSIVIHGVNGNFNKKFNATVVATDKHNDLALLLIEGANTPNTGIPYSIKIPSAEVGEEVFVLGYPLTSTMGKEIKLTTGVISSKTGFQGDVSLYQISAPIQPGNSGGPLFNSKGDVIGIVSSKHLGTENVGYAIKTTYLKNLLETSTSEKLMPQNNKLSGLNLSEKVKAVKDYVYYITCSASTRSNNEATQGTPTTQGEFKGSSNGTSITGYRVQVYKGGNTKNDREAANRIGQEMKNLFKDEAVYVHFFLPNWICRIGDYRTYEEAYSVKQKLENSGYKDVLIVKGRITVK